MAENQPHIVVIGGGAAGIFGAIRAKNLAPEARVTVLESAPKCLGKVKISGGGRCNVTHHCDDIAQLVRHYPRGEKALKSVFSRFAPRDTMNWFAERGVKLKIEPDGRMFPVTDSSQTVIDCLLTEARKVGVDIRTQYPVRRVEKVDHGFQLIPANGQAVLANALLIASGSAAIGHEIARQFAHQLIEPVPSLFTFVIRNALLTDLAGISFPHVRGKLLVPDEKPIIQEGPLLITHTGLSGPAILRLSAWGARVLAQVNYRARLTIDFLPQETEDGLRGKLSAQKEQTPAREIKNESPIEVPRRFWERLLQQTDIALETRWRDVPIKSINRLVQHIKQYPFDISGKNMYKDEFVTAGGVALPEIDFKTMGSRRVPGVFFAGEIIDVDGLTGGFNFQNAWATGWLAGAGLADYIRSLS